MTAPMPPERGPQTPGGPRRVPPGRPRPPGAGRAPRRGDGVLGLLVAVGVVALAVAVFGALAALWLGLA